MVCSRPTWTLNITRVEMLPTGSRVSSFLGVLSRAPRSEWHCHKAAPWLHFRLSECHHVWAPLSSTRDHYGYSTKFEVAVTQIIPTLFHNICSFIVTCELCGVLYSAHMFAQVHTIQKAPDEAGQAGWYFFNNKKGYMSAIERKSKLKNLKYNFIYIRCCGGWGTFRYRVRVSGFDQCHICIGFSG